jgi:tRNA-splicing ligase RtcB (3'-phosphate/5'-hydroxy nucleic acid ligase)
MQIISQEFNNARKSIGTLGGGNHFIEIQKGNDGHIWIMIHSGSRNLGKQVADHYNKEAIRMNGIMHSSVTKELELAFLPTNTKESKALHRLRLRQQKTNDE